MERVLRARGELPVHTVDMIVRNTRDPQKAMTNQLLEKFDLSGLAHKTHPVKAIPAMARKKRVELAWWSWEPFAEQGLPASALETPLKKSRVTSGAPSWP